MKTLYTIGKLAEYFGVSRTTIQNWFNEGMPHHLEGLTYAFDLKEVEKWISKKSRKHSLMVESARKKAGRS